MLIHFPEVVSAAAEKYAPNLITNYIFNLAQLFNVFYEKHKIIGSTNEEFRLGLTAGVGQVLKKGLYLLGISAPERI
jgi:arginyl-tRNA synthetase